MYGKRTGMAVYPGYTYLQDASLTVRTSICDPGVGSRKLGIYRGATPRNLLATGRIDFETTMRAENSPEKPTGQAGGEHLPIILS